MKLIFVTAVFLITYVLLAFKKDKRSPLVWMALGLIVVVDLFSGGERIWQHPIEILRDVNWNVIAIFVGTLWVAETFTLSLAPRWVAGKIVARASSVGWAILWLAAFSGLLSAFVENVATVLILAPIAFEIARSLSTSPVPFLISIAISSNLQGVATLIGDPPSMILAAHLKMTFNDFFFLQGKPGIFFAVEIGALAAFVVLYFIFRRFKQPVVVIEETRATSWIPTLFLLLMITALAFSSFFDRDFRGLAGAICLFFGAVAKVWERWHTNALAFDHIKKSLRAIDWDTTFFLMGIFALVGALTRVGLLEQMAALIRTFIKGNLVLAFGFVVWISVLVSAFIDNVPYVTAMLPIVTILANQIGTKPYLLGFGLLIGACIGGNVTPIGASANIVAIGCLRRQGCGVGFLDFIKIGLPFTIAGIFASSVFLWLVWK